MPARPVDFRKRLGAVLLAMVLPLVAALFYFVWFQESRATQVLYACTKLFTLTWPLLVTRFGFGEPLKVGALWGRPTTSGVALGLGLGGVIAAMTGFLYGYVLSDWVQDHAAAIRAKTESLGILRHYWRFGLFIALIHSLIEEYYWRWFVFGQLRLLVPRAWAHGLAAVAFSSHHVVIVSQYFGVLGGFLLGGAVGVGGLIWSILYQKQQSLAGIWISHALADLAILAVGHHVLFGTIW